MPSDDRQRLRREAVEMRSSDWDRFWAKVQTGDGCWEWTGCLAKGYGHLRVNRRMKYAHRLMMEWFAGRELRRDEVVMHAVCDNPRCVRPDHLRVSTQKDNMMDMSRKERTRAAVLTSRDVRRMRLRYGAGSVSQGRLAAEFGVAQTTVSLIVRGITWRGVQ